MPLVALVAETRSGLINFLSETIFRETRSMLGDLEQSVVPSELSVKTYRLKKLLEILDCMKSGVYQYLQLSINICNVNKVIECRTMNVKYRTHS